MFRAKGTAVPSVRPLLILHRGCVGSHVYRSSQISTCVWSCPKTSVVLHFFPSRRTRNKHMLSVIETTYNDTTSSKRSARPCSYSLVLSFAPPPRGRLGTALATLRTTPGHPALDLRPCKNLLMVQAPHPKCFPRVGERQKRCSKQEGEREGERERECEREVNAARNSQGMD